MKSSDEKHNRLAVQSHKDIREPLRRDPGLNCQSAIIQFKMSQENSSKASTRRKLRMLEKARRDRVGLGLIGLGPSWELHYREPIARLQNRLTIKLVYDSVEARARSVAADFEAGVASSLRQMLSWPSLQGILVLDPGWCATGTLELVAMSGKPAFLGRAVLRHAMTLPQSSVASFLLSRNLHAAHIDDLLMPELSLRFTPATCRLRELIATKLGRPKEIAIECDAESTPQEKACLVDWCSHVMGHRPHPIALTNGHVPEIPELLFEFPPLTTGHDAKFLPGKRVAKIRPRANAGAAIQIQVECERGRATLVDRTHIAWQSPDESREESLNEERTEIEILIDQFCRRALGGLIPIGRISDLWQAMEVLKKWDDFKTSH